MNNNSSRAILLLQWAARREQVFTVAFSKYEDGNEVVFYADMKGQGQQLEDSQKFKANANGTISPLKSVDLVLGMETTSGT